MKKNTSTKLIIVFVALGTLLLVAISHMIEPSIDRIYNQLFGCERTYITNSRPISLSNIEFNKIPTLDPNKLDRPNTHVMFKMKYGDDYEWMLIEVVENKTGELEFYLTEILREGE